MGQLCAHYFGLHVSPPINGDTPAAKRVFDRADWPALANELQYPVNSVSTSQVAEDSVSLLLALGYENETYPSTMSLQDWSPHEAGAALQKWKKKLRKAFSAIGINEGKQPVSRLATLEEDPSKVPLPATPKRLERTPPTKRGADRDAFGTADASPYLQDSHMVTPRSTSRTRRMDTEDDGSQGHRGKARASRSVSGRRRATTYASSSDDDDLLPHAYEAPQPELTRQMREIAALNDSDPTPRIEMTSHRPLDRIKPFSGSRNKSENSIQWLRTFKTKRTWKLLSNAFIRYYCSQFTQTALSRYYSAKRERSEHLCDYLNRLNGYARNARLQFEKGGREAKEQVQQFLVTCGDDNMAESLYHTRVNDIHELEEIIEDVLKGKERMAKRDGVPRHSRSRDSRRDEPHDRQSRRDRCESDRHRDDYRNTPRVTLAEISLDDLLALLEGSKVTRSGDERSGGEHHAYEDDQDEYNHYQSDDASSDGSLVDNDRHLAAANEGERRAAAEGTTVEVANAASIKTAEVVPAASIKTLVENETSIVTTGVHSMDHVLRVVGISHSAHFCNKRCMFCKQAHDVGQCELFRNFQDLAKFVRIKGTKEELPLSSSLPFKSAI
ncbi:hypothetical protein PC119_g13576 [Phytophthora cactorum]|nr:hypothetical protein PC119_g13576 [Phytophthora cactorum]